MSERKSPTAEAPVCLWDQGIDNNGDGVGRVRRARGLRDDDRGVDRGRGIPDESKG